MKKIANFENVRLGGGYYFYPNHHFLGFKKHGTTHKDIYTNGQGDGWKMHLSIHPDDLVTAWEAVVPILMKHGIEAAKICDEEKAARWHDPQNGQGGKQITIYEVSEKAPAGLAADLEQVLRAAKIRPSLAVKGDRQIPGSAYISYRNEIAPRGVPRIISLIDEETPFYVSSHEVRELIAQGSVPAHQAHNPFGRPDPLAVLDFTARADMGSKVTQEMAQEALSFINCSWDYVSSPSHGEQMRLPMEGASKKQKEYFIERLSAFGIAAELVTSRSKGRDFLQISPEAYEKLGEAALAYAPEEKKTPSFVAPNKRSLSQQRSRDFTP